MNTLNLNNFIDGYIACMLWSTSSETPDGEELEDLTEYPLAAQSIIDIHAECTKFVNENENLLSQVYNRPTDYQSAGHDFWLTRNGHGAGFWDRGFGVIGDALTDRSKEYKELSPYIGDDGKVYF